MLHIRHSCMQCQVPWGWIQVLAMLPCKVLTSKITAQVQTKLLLGTLLMGLLAMALVLLEVALVEPKVSQGCARTQEV